MPSAPPTFERLVPLKDDVLLTLSGAGGAKLLQGQASADFTSTSYPSAVEGVFCDTKGRVIADFLALMLSPEEILLRVSASVAPILCAALDKYLPFFKVTLEESEHSVWGGFCQPDNSPPDLTEPSAEVPAAPAVVATEFGMAVRRSPSHWEHFAIDKVPTDAVPPNDWQWQCDAIKRHEARVLAPTSGLYLPQDLNYDLRGLINFKKGCYTGQEIVARLHWRGTPKRRLQLARLSEGNLPMPGTALIDSHSEQRVGSVINAAPCDSGILLAIEATDVALSSGCHLADQSAELQPLSSGL